MKNKISLYSLCCCFIVFMACSTTGGSTSGEETIVCFGDSLTAGYSATIIGRDDKSKSYPAFLQKKVNIPVINAGVDGNTTAQGLARVKKDVLSKNPKIVIIELGANDNLQEIPVITTKNNLQKIIDMVNDGSCKIYLTKWLPEMNEQSENMFNTLASSNNIELIEGVLDGVQGIHTGPDYHPTAKGQEMVAEHYFNALKPYLEANNLLRE